MRQLHTMDFAGVPLGSGMPVFPPTLSLLEEEEAAGWYGMVPSFVSGSVDTSTQEWVENYKDRYDGQTPSQFESAACDGGRMIGIALEEVLQENAEATVEEIRNGVREVLSNMTYVGLDDTRYVFDSEGRGAHDVTVLVVEEDKSLRTIARIEGAPSDD